uniref:Uncharacterized protein n=1 Tax=Arundo donax TaxID=35708 RepID=A0A0A9GPJ2_ARUDO
MIIYVESIFPAARKFLFKFSFTYGCTKRKQFTLSHSML